MTHDELVVHLRGFSPNAPRDNERERCLQAADTIEQMREEIAVLRSGLDVARKQIVEITCDATQRLREIGYECDPAERTYMPALDRIDAALSLNSALPPIAETKE